MTFAAPPLSQACLRYSSPCLHRPSHADAVTRPRGGAVERIMHSGGTLGGGDMGQSGMAAGPIQRPDLDPSH